MYAESLPISSSGHTRLLSSLSSFKRAAIGAIPRSVEHLMHIPNGLIIGIFLWNHAGQATLFLSKDPYSLLLALCCTNLITGVVYLITKKIEPKTPLYGGFLLSSATLLSLYFLPCGTSTAISLVAAFLIGCAQSISLLPGVSRMALTTVSALWLGIEPCLSFLFSLTCELALIVVAVSVALFELKKERISWSLSTGQLLMLSILMFTSYCALELSYFCFVHNYAHLFGWYLLGVALLAAYLKHD